MGGYVLRELKRQNSPEKITVLSSNEIEGIRTVLSQNYNFDEKYLSDNGCEDIEVMIHIGAWIPKVAKEADNFIEATSNITSTQKLLMSHLPKLKKILYCSTTDVYGDVSGIITENTPVAPQSMYGWSKLYCEKMIESFAYEKNLTFQILRLGHVYGEGEEKYRKVMPVMIKNAIHGRDIMIYGDGEAVRTFIYAGDVAKAVVRAIGLENSNVINIVGNEPITINQLGNMIAIHSGKSIKIHHQPAERGRDCLFDNQRLRNTLLEELIPFETGLRREIEYIKKVEIT